MIENWEWLVHQTVVLLFRGTLIGRRNVKRKAQ